MLNVKDAIPIVDFYHAIKHAAKVLLALLGSKEHPDYQRRHGEWAKRLLKEGIVKLIAGARKECAGDPRVNAVEKELPYFTRNVQRMQYASFRSHGFFIGSDVIETGCRTVIVGRCKHSGMFWGEPGAKHILALRCINASRRDADSWKHRLAELAARNAPVPRAA